MAVVYWIHAPHHTDIFTEGYVGVTIFTAEYRFGQHKRAAHRGDDLPIHRAILKYGDNIRLSVILEGSEEYCYLMEGELRSKPGMGYNAAIGGNASGMSGMKHTPEAIEKIRNSYRVSGTDHPNFGKEVSEHTRKLLSEKAKARKRTPMRQESKDKLSKKLKGDPRVKHDPWNNGQSNKKVWLQAGIIFDVYTLFGKPAHYKMATLMGEGFTSGNLNAIVRRFRGGWNPFLDDKWLAFYLENGESHG